MRKPTDSPYKGGTWRKADLDAYCQNKRLAGILWGLAFAVGVAVLAHMIVRFAGWLGGR